MTRIIINADDFGHDDDCVAATIECFENGSLTSATIMPKMPATAAAIEYAKSHPQFSFGVHLTFVSNGIEYPMSDPKEIAALCASSGQFRRSQTMRVLAMWNRLPVDQIERETAAQLAFVRDHGVAISHVDTHGHLHKFGPFLRALANVMPRFGIKRLRTAQDVYLRKPLKSPTFWYGPVWRRKIMARFLTTDHLFMPTSPGDALEMARLVPRLPGGSIEVGVHPGRRDAWRDPERIGVQSFAANARAAGHQLINWNDL